MNLSVFNQQEGVNSKAISGSALSLRLKAYSMAVLLLTCSTQVLGLEPQTIKLAGFDVAPVLSVQHQTNDNIYRDEGAGKVSSSILVISPSLEGVMERDLSRYTFNASIIDGSYSKTSEDDYTDFVLSGVSEFSVAERHIISLKGAFNSTHEARGTGLSQDGNLPAEMNLLDTVEYGVGYQFGGNSRGSISVDYVVQDLEYSNNSPLTDIQNRKSDSLEITFGVAFPKASSSLLLKYQLQNEDYTLDDLAGLGSRDSDEEYYYVGIEWQPTARLSGSALVGYGQKEYDSVLRQSQNIPSWDVSIAWRPLSYSVFELTANNSFREAFDIGNSVESQTLGLSWQHGWSDRVESTLNFRTVEDGYGGISRKDDGKEYSAQLSYSFRRWLDITLTASRDEHDSNDLIFQYNQSVYSLGFLISL